MKNLSKQDIRDLITLLKEQVYMSDSWHSAHARAKAHGLMKLANKLAGYDVFESQMLTEKQFAFLKLVYQGSVFHSRLQTYRLRLANQFLKEGLLTLEVCEDYGETPNLLALTDKGDRILNMRAIR